MLDQNGFDLWADGYDKTVGLSDEENSYPFAGYKEILASARMPNAHLFRGDFSQGLVEPLLQNSYDFIIATYSLHHLTDEGKITFIQSLTDLLERDGIILIGDVAFANRADLIRCQKEAGEEWDDDEIYFVFEELRQAFPKMKFDQVSYCAGLLSLSR